MELGPLGKDPDKSYLAFTFSEFEWKDTKQRCKCA